MRTVIVGGGILGLTLALRLTRGGHAVTVLEAAPELGGLAAPWQLGDVRWDRHYHVTLLSDRRTRALAAELGLADAFVWSTAKTGFYSDGRLSSMSNALEFARFPALGPLDKVRLGMTIARAARVRDARRFDGIAAGAWLRRWSGKRTYAKIWRPLLRAKLGDAHERAAASFIVATIARLYAARRAGLERELFGTVRGGYATVFERFAAVLRDAGVTVRTGARVRRVDPATGGFSVTVDGDPSPLHAARVVLTVPPAIAARLVPALPERDRERLAAVPYQGIVCASLLLRRALSPYYVTNITDAAPFTGIIEMTALVDPATFGGRHLVYLPKYCAPDDPLQRASDDEIRATFLDGLHAIHPGLRDDDVEAFRVSRVPYVFPIPVVGGRAALPPPETALDGLWAVNASHIVDGTLNVDETVGLADDIARRLLAAPAPSLARTA